VLLDSGATNEPLAELFTSIPAQENEDAPVQLPRAIDLDQLIPSGSALARYQGSLTTPPCTEGVRWNVFLTPATLSADQIAAFCGVFAHNSGPVQPLNGRTVVQTAAGR
jgi:carbonic anhydrase